MELIHRIFKTSPKGCRIKRYSEPFLTKRNVFEVERADAFSKDRGSCRTPKDGLCGNPGNQSSPSDASPRGRGRRGSRFVKDVNDGKIEPLLKSEEVRGGDRHGQNSELIVMFLVHFQN